MPLVRSSMIARSWCVLALGVLAGGLPACGSDGRPRLPAPDGGAELSGTGGSSGAGVGGSAGWGGSNAAAGGRAGSTTGGAAAGGSAGGGGAASGPGGAGGAGDASGPGAMVNPAPGSKPFVGANFWNIGWEGSANYFASGVNFASTRDPWRREFLADLAPYKVLRFMDWNLANNSDNPQADWGARTQKTDTQDTSVAIEWQIDLCNRTGKDYWITVPHEADPAYWKKLAQLIHDTLDPRLRVYVEWSNEVWNPQFPQRGYAQAQGSMLGLSGRDPGAYYVYASVRLFEAFEAVFGKGSARLVKVLSGQADWGGPCQAHVKALADAQINPKSTRADVYAIAPYLKGRSIGELEAGIAELRGWVESNGTCAAAVGLPLIAYEGGSDSFSSDDWSVCTTLQQDPAMQRVYTQLLDAMNAAKLLGPFVHYTHSGDCWGLKRRTADSLERSPKYKAVVDWFAAH